ncbi:hypothetical protein ARC20_04840 [Stenotrophomonas panacihumi]|uniref:Uncharacterized protein n=1 Tax=Stenotrophomonas panacihumi TaxID=676599 RepID=A0A0R0AZ57_9GAMM|nr:hypothetical protein [Stenotrophomonas panacihumi]KRG46769.1 hypothetical protein ARC20_04840 [Stenotrophomonas panacihumi]PTN54632.1 hypothetical protein C9J98_10380 [Stenotrophomonas panacihumi]
MNRPTVFRARTRPCHPLAGGKVFRRAALGFRLRCAPAPVLAPHLAGFTAHALALRRIDGPPA